MLLKELTELEFQQFADTFPTKSLYQSKEYAFVMQRQKFEILFLGLTQNEKILAASLILIDKVHNFKYAYAPRGFLLDYTNFELFELFTKEIKKYLGKRNIIAIKLNPYVLRYTHIPAKRLTRKDSQYDTIFENFGKLGYHHTGYNYFFEAFKPRYEAYITLDVPKQLLFKNIRKEFRTKIRGAEERGMQLYLGTENELDHLYLQTKKKYPRDLAYFKDCYQAFHATGQIDFYYIKLDTAIYLQTMTNRYREQEEICNILSQKLVNQHSQHNEKFLNQKIEADNLFNQYHKELILATNLLKNYPEGMIIASALVVKNRNEAYLLMDGYDTKYKRLNAKHLLIWKLCEHYAQEGFQTFNLGGITDLDLPKNPYRGLNDFKIGFHANVHEYMGDMELITNNTLYFMYRNSIGIRNILKK